MQLNFFEQLEIDTSEDYAFNKLGYTSKVCSDCGLEKDLHEFGKHVFRMDKRNRRCKDCESIRNRRKTRLRKTAPPPPADNVCECCGKVAKNEKLFFDECHITDTFRGWICRSCNQGIGMLGDNKEGLLTAIDYLERHENGLRATEEANTFTPKNKLQELNCQTNIWTSPTYGHTGLFSFSS